MQIPPLSVIIHWPLPDHENPETRGDTLLVLMIVFSILVLTAVSGRLYSRCNIKHWLGWDDGLIILATVFTIGMNVTVILANQKYGWDRHVWDVPPDMVQDANIVAFAAKLLFVEASTFTRMSLICFYYRLVRDSGIVWFRWILHASMAIVVALGIAFTCLGIWLCVPVQAYWVYPAHHTATYHCLDEGTVTLTIGVINCCADLLCTLLPIPLVARLQMPLKSRVGVCCLLTLGFVVTIAGVVRTYFIWESLLDSRDETWFSYPLWICAGIETDVAVICASAPALRPLVHRLFARVTSTLSSSNPPLGPHSRPRLVSTASSDDSVWDSDAIYGMLRQREAEVQTPSSTVTGMTTTETTMESVGLGAGEGKRKPLTLGIRRRCSVDQIVDRAVGGDGM